MSSARADGAMEAVSALLLDRAHLLLPLAAQFGAAQPHFESAIHGSSMAPALPAGARLRVRPAAQQPCQVGDVVFFLADGHYTVHRVVYRRRLSSELDWLLTAGDARFAPDAPVPCGKVLGTVVDVHVDGQWQPLGPQPPAPWHRRAVRAVTVPAMIVAMWVSVEAATRLAAMFLSFESRARLARRRLLRLWAR